jgi:hypothetical protein
MLPMIIMVKFKRLITLQRYLTRCRLPSLFSVRETGAVVALLSPGDQLENGRNRQCFEGQDHQQQSPKLGHGNGWRFFPPNVSANARGRSGLTWW